MKKITLGTLCAMTLWITPVSAQEASIFTNEPTHSGEVTQAAIENSIRENLKRIAPEMPVKSVSESVIPGVYVVVSGSQIYYLTPDGKYMIEGSIIDLPNRVNLSDQHRGKLQMSVLEQMPEETMVVFNNKTGDAQRSITVFTDTDCGYCQKLHQEVGRITAADIKVRYILYPRAGIQSASSTELQSIWCSDDQQAAMTLAKSGGHVAHTECENPIQSHMDLAGEVGLRGTPLIFLDDGTKIPGYRPAAEIIEQVMSSEPYSGG